jgi:hypothetical protein
MGYNVSGMYGAPCMHVVRSHVSYVLRCMFWHIPSAAISDTNPGSRRASTAYTLAQVNE